MCNFLIWFFSDGSVTCGFLISALKEKAEINAIETEMQVMEQVMKAEQEFAD